MGTSPPAGRRRETAELIEFEGLLELGRLSGLSTLNPGAHASSLNELAVRYAATPATGEGRRAL